MLRNAKGLPLCCALIAACGSGQPAAEVNASVVAQGTREGGTIILGDVATLQMGAGAVSVPLQITMRVVEPRVALPAAAAGKAVEFTPHGARFDVPARISLKYQSNAPAARLQVLRLADDAATQWLPVGGVRFSGGAATFDTTTFSTYVVTDGYACAALAAGACDASCGACGTACGADAFCSQAAACVPFASASFCENGAVTVIHGQIPDLAVVAPAQTGDAIYAKQIADALAARCGATIADVPQAQPGMLDPCTDAPLLTAGHTILLVGGSFGQRLATWANLGPSPVIYSHDSATSRTRFTSRSGAVLVDFADAQQTPTHDYFVIALLRDPARGALVLEVYGVGWEGTPAAAWYFVNRVLPDPQGRGFAQYLVVEWTDDGDGVKGAGDTWTVLAKDTP